MKIVTEAEFDAFLRANKPEDRSRMRVEYQQIGDPPSTRYYLDGQVIAVKVHNWGPSGDEPEYRISESPVGGDTQ